MDIKNIMRNVTPSLTVMVVGLVGAYFVYNTYFSDRVATGVASYEPAAGEEAVVQDETTLETAAPVEGEVAVEGEAVEGETVEGEATADGEVMFQSGEETAPAEETTGTEAAPAEEAAGEAPVVEETGTAH